MAIEISPTKNCIKKQVDKMLGEQGLDYTQWEHFSSGCYYMCSAIMFVYQLRNKENNLQIWLKWLLLFIFLINSACFFVFYVDNVFGENMNLDINMMQLLAIPACASLLYEIIIPNSLTWKKVILSMSPFAVLWPMTHLCGMDIFYTADAVLAVTLAVVAIVWATLRVIRYERMLYTNFSSLERRDLKWLSIILFEFISLLVLWIVSTIFSSQLGNICYNLLSCLIWINICYFVNRQKIVEFRNNTDIADTEDKDFASEKSQDERFHFAERFKHLVEEEKRYLDPDLSLNDLAMELNTNRTYISQYINGQMNTTFYDYINTLRIEHATQLLCSTDDKIEIVALESGYNSPATFRRIFSKIHGCSASEYRRKHGK